MADDVGWYNIGAYNDGIMAGVTPNIDKIAKNGMRFTDYYAESSCTAGRANLITGELPIRTGLTTVGQAGANVGMPAEAPTIATVLKSMGYSTGQFGKNHFGDLNKHLPTVHGFDEFWGYLYHLDAMEDSVWHSYQPELNLIIGPRNLLHTWASDVDDSTVDPRWGKVGKQIIEDAGPLPPKRMETVDDETSAAAMDFIERQHKAGKPFFVWMNSTRMHFRTHVKAERRSPPGLTALTEYADGMVEHDAMVGALLKKLDDLGIAGNTIVLYTTDNGPHMNSWPDGAMTPFRSEKNTNWEGAFRVPAMIRWPGKIQTGAVSNEMFSGLDWLPTLLAAAGESDITAKLLKGHAVGGKTFKVHLDGYNQLPYLLGEQPKSARNKFFYFDDDGDLVGMRYANWKIAFSEQRAPGTMRVWAEPFTTLRLPKLFDLRADPYERADITSNTYYDWFVSQPYVIFIAQEEVAKFLATFKEFPPSQRAQSFTVDQIIEKMQKSLESTRQ
jgi:arylsulfatase